MTFNEFVVETELLYESLNSSAAPGFTPTEWGKLFTIAQRKVVLKILNEGINKNTFNQLAIEKLVQADSYTAFTTNTHFKNLTGTSAFTLDTIAPPVGAKVFNILFFWILDEYITTATNSNIPVKRITFDFYRTNLKNPFRVPNTTEGFWMLQYNNLPVFITDGSTPTGYNIIGVEHPDNYPIVSGTLYGTHASCLNPSVHSKIVEETVTLARMSVNDTQGYQLAMAEFNK